MFNPSAQICHALFNCTTFSGYFAEILLVSVWSSAKLNSSQFLPGIADIFQSVSYTHLTLPTIYSV